MTIAQELKDQIDFLRLPSTVWRKGYPHQINQACAVIRFVLSESEDRGRYGTFSLSTIAFLDKTLFNEAFDTVEEHYRYINGERLSIQEIRCRSCKRYWSADEDGYSSYMIHFNDDHAKDKEEIISLLKKAYHIAIRDNL